MTHIFDTNIAVEYGVEIAIVVNHLAFWIQKNEANGKHMHNGKVWTYNSIKAFSELFPYWTERQIRRILMNMEELKIIETANFNKVSYDRTKWYTFTYQFINAHKPILQNGKMHFTESSNAYDQTVKSILPNGQMEVTKRSNGSDQTVSTIPDINTYNKPDSKPVDKTRNSSFAIGDFPDGKIPKAESVRKENKYTEDKTEILFSEIENLDSNTHIPEIKKRFELKKEIQDIIPEEKEIEVAEYDIYDLDIEYSDNEYTEINESEIENISTVKENEIQETEKINKMKNTKNEFFEPKKDTIKNTTPENSIISFWSKFPELATHKNRNTKLYKKANEYTTALLDHSFADTYEFDNNWKIDNNLRILPVKELTEKTLKSAIMDYTLCFEPEYKPENKEYLTKSIVDFIYNPVTKKSQLLFILNHKPQLITKPDPSLARKHIPSEIASRVDNILSHKYSRINDLHRLEVYNNVLRTLKKFTEIKKLGKYQVNKSNFSYIKSIERLWLDYLSNRSKITKFDFSPDNFTFNNFIEHMENEYDVSLDTSEKNIRRLQHSYEKSLQSKQKEVKLVENELNIDDLLL